MSDLHTIFEIPRFKYTGYYNMKPFVTSAKNRYLVMWCHNCNDSTKTAYIKARVLIYQG